jgi:hypothetical protein
MGNAAAAAALDLSSVVTAAELGEMGIPFQSVQAHMSYYQERSAQPTTQNRPMWQQQNKRACCYVLVCVVCNLLFTSSDFFMHNNNVACITRWPEELIQLPLGANLLQYLSKNALLKSEISTLGKLTLLNQRFFFLSVTCMFIVYCM